MKKYLIIGGLFLLAGLLVFLFSNNTDYVKTGKIYINEIVSSNKSVYQDDDNEYSDYIELYNGYNYDIDLTGYSLSDSLYGLNKWLFGNVSIKANNYLIIFASGKNRCQENICHTSFKLNADGEYISLIDNTGNIISQVKYPKMMSDASYSYVDGKYGITLPTPGKENSHEIVEKIDISKYDIIINEYLSHNKGITYNSDGISSDWVELYNKTNKDLNLQGLSLSDDPGNLNKSPLPNVTIKAHDYLVVYLTGGEKTSGAYTNFKLSDNDEKIILSGNDEIIDQVEVKKLEKNMSYGLKDGKWLYFLTPTPGKENNTYGMEVLK